MLSRMPHQDTQIAYAACQMKIGADRTHKTCVEAFGVSWQDILQCVGSDFATRQQLEFERVSGPVLAATRWVPSVIYNGQISQYTHTGRSPPLKNILCELSSNSKEICLHQ